MSERSRLKEGPLFSKIESGGGAVKAHASKSNEDSEPFVAGFSSETNISGSLEKMPWMSDDVGLPATADSESLELSESTAKPSQLRKSEFRRGPEITLNEEDTTPNKAWKQLIRRSKEFTEALNSAKGIMEKWFASPEVESRLINSFTAKADTEKISRLAGTLLVNKEEKSDINTKLRGTFGRSTTSEPIKETGLRGTLSSRSSVDSIKEAASHLERTISESVHAVGETAHGHTVSIDATELTKKYLEQYEQLVICSVTDGAGGSASAKMTEVGAIDGPVLSQAYIGARLVQAAVGILYQEKAEVFTQSAQNIWSAIIEEVNKTYNIINNHYKKAGGEGRGLKGTMQKPYHTTLALAVMRKERDKSKVELEIVLAGDSPVVIITPNSIISSENPKSTAGEVGEGAMDTYISQEEQLGHVASLSFDADQPLIIVSASDAFMKTQEGTVQKFVDIIFDCMGKAENHKHLEELFVLAYEHEMSRAGAVYDDATISWNVHFPPGTSLANFNKNAPIEQLPLVSMK